MAKEYGLWYLAKKYGIKSILISLDLWVAIICLVLVSIFYIPNFKFNDTCNTLLSYLIGVNAGLLGIILTGFSILIALMSKKFKDVLVLSGVYSEIVFLFTYSAFLVSLGLFFSIFTTFATTIGDFWGRYVLFPTSTFFSIYGLFSVILLLFHVRDVAMLNGEM